MGKLDDAKWQMYNCIDVLNCEMRSRYKTDLPINKRIEIHKQKKKKQKKINNEKNKQKINKKHY